MFVLGEMAVQGWREKSTRMITGENITFAYNSLLVDINKCIYMRKSLETERTYKEVAMDWTAGQRVSIPKLIELMENWKKEVEKGSCLLMTLLRKMNEVGMLDISDEKIKNYASSTMNPHVEKLEDICTRFLKAVKNLQDVGILKENKVSGVGTFLGNILTGFNDRNTRYAELQSLFESLNNSDLMGALQETHRTIENLIKEIDELMKKCEAESMKKETKSSVQSAIKATKMFYETEKEELQELVATEPDMNEDTKKKIAKRAAVRNCKTFLTGKLQYSNAEADEFINDLQN